MQRIEYPVTHVYQSTNHNCSQTALSILLSHYGLSIPPDQIQEAVPTLKDENGKDLGSINQQIATWCLKQSWSVLMYTFDGQIVDFSWTNLSPQEVRSRLEAVKGHRDVKNIGKPISEAYVQSYIDFLDAGGEISDSNGRDFGITLRITGKRPDSGGRPLRRAPWYGSVASHRCAGICPRRRGGNHRQPLCSYFWAYRAR